MGELYFYFTLIIIIINIGRKLKGHVCQGKCGPGQCQPTMHYVCPTYFSTHQDPRSVAPVSAAATDNEAAEANVANVAFLRAETLPSPC